VNKEQKMTSQKYPKFDLTKSSPYDESTYSGRFLHFLDVIDPRTLFKTNQQVEQAVQLLKDYSSNQTIKINDDELWEALKLKQAAINPGTNEIITRPFRMSAFLPANVPIIFGMLSTTSPIGTVFWQVVNASYNSALNYANRSGADVSNSQLIQSYLLAVTTAVGLSLGIRQVGSRGKLKVMLDKVPFVVPYMAVAGAGAANVYASRRVEIVEGVPITDESGEVVFGTSKEAGKQGVYKTILTRAMGLPLPVLVLPPIIMKALPKVKSPQANVGLELVVITMCLAGALPATIALYPQRLVLNVSSLEGEFQNLKHPKTGEPVTEVYANKGL
jgi:tricarboxylate carrier